MQETQVPSLGGEDPLEEGMTTHSNILAWRIPWTVAHQTPLSVGFSRQEYWSGLSCPPPRDLPCPEIEPMSLTSSVLGGGASDTESICQGRRHKRERFDPWVRKISQRQKWQPTPVFLPGENPMDRGSWQAIVHGVAKSRTRLSNSHTDIHTSIPSQEFLPS